MKSELYLFQQIFLISNKVPVFLTGLFQGVSFFGIIRDKVLWFVAVLMINLIFQSSSAFANQPYSIYEDYKISIWMIIFTILILLLIIALLIFNTWKYSRIDERNAEESAFQENEERARLLLESMKEGIGVLDENGLFTYVNEFLCNMLGFSEQELLNHSPSEFLDENSKHILKNELSKRRIGIETPYEVVFIKKNKEKAYVIIAPKANYDDSGVFQGSFGVITDITKQKQTEKLLTERIKFEEILSNISSKLVNLKAHEIDSEIEGVLRLIAEHLEMDRCAVYQKFGDSEYHKVTHSWTVPGVEIEKEIIPEIDLIWLYKKLQRGEIVIFSNYNDFPVEAEKDILFLKKKGIKSGIGIPVMVEGTIMGIISAGSFRKERKMPDEIYYRLQLVGQILGNVLIRKEYEITQKSTTQFLETILDHTPMMVAYLDSELNYMRVNQAYATMRKKKPSFFLGKNHCDLYPDNKKILDKIVETGEPYREYLKPIELEEYPERGVSYWDWSLIPIKNSLNAVTGIVLTIVDVSERKIIEKELIQADKLISLGTLVAGVAHEINNPNNFITINTPILLKAWKSILPVLDDYYQTNGDFPIAGIPYSNMKERVPKLLSGISDGSLRIKRIVQDLKGFAQPEFSACDDLVDINSVVRSALNLIGNMVTNNTENFLVEYGPNLPPVLGNYQRLEQVVINLIQNACYALSDKSKAVYVSTFYDKKTDAVLVKIVDEGEGIPTRDLPWLMDPFFTTRRDSGGTGLGLSVSSTIVREHSGRINVDSKPGEGSTFTVSIPLAREDMLKKVMVVDDDDSVRNLIVEMINNKFTCKVEESVNGIECCLRLGTFQPDILIIDIHMQDMNGVEVCKKIKSDSALSKVQVLVVTGYPNSNEAKEIKEMGFTTVISKPFESKRFNEIIEKLLT